MIADLDTRPPGRLEGYDLCIVGTGPAGLTLARELHGSGLSLCVLESGLTRPTRRGDRLRETRSKGIHIKEYSRERVLGGASTTWAGLSAPLDPVDLAPRAHVPYSGWPLDPDELAGDYAAATRYRFPGQADFEAFATLRDKGDLEPRWEAIEEKLFLAADPPQNFAAEWGSLFEEEGIDLFLDATVQRLELAQDESSVRAAHVRTRSGNEHEVHSGAFVLACGGIENARLLLLSGIGGEAVGRWLMNHPKNYRGTIHLARPVQELPYYFGCLKGGFAGYAGLRLRTDLQTERGLLNSYVRLEPIFPWTDNPGVEALVTLVKGSAGLLRFWKASQQDEVISLRDYSETGDDSEVQNRRKGPLAWIGLIGTVALHLPGVLKYLFYRLSKRAPRIRRARLRNFMEMAPDPANRVTLAQELDEDGKPLPQVEHRCTELDRRSLVQLHQALAAEIEAAGLGRLESDLTAELDPWPIDQDASHHMGTTRMGTDPAVSVVDPNLAVHGVPNLYAAGASVFPTSGCVNPTFTIVALSIRLARHLRKTLAPIHR